MVDDLEFVLPITEEEFETSGSKWITFDPNAAEGTIELRNVEIGVVDWDTPGVSLKYPVTIIDGIDKGKTDKLSAGVSKDAVWKIKEIHKALGVPVQMKDGKPVIKPKEVSGKNAVGVWIIRIGTKGGVAGADKTVYPKLEAIQPEGYTLQTASLV